MQWVSLPQDTAAKGRGFRVLPSGGIKGWWRPHVDGRLVGRCPRQVGLGLRLLGLGLGIFRPWCSFDLLRIGVSRLVVAEMANVTFDTSGTRTFQIARHVRSSAIDTRMVDLPPLLGALVVPRRLFALQVSLLQGRRLMLILGPRRGSFVLVHDGGFARIVSGGRLPLGLEGCRKQVLGWYAAAPLWISGLTACLAVLILPGFEMGSQ